MTTDHWIRAMVGVVAILALLAAFNIARAVVAPIACALFIISIVWPLQSRLQSSLPKLIALAIVILVTSVVFTVFISLVTWGFGRVGRSLIAEAGRFQLLYGQATAWLETYGIVAAGSWSDHFNTAWLLRNVQGIATRLNTTLAFWLVVIVYVMLGLLEVDDVRRKLESLKERTVARVLLAGSTTIAAKFRRYMLIRTAMSLTTGVIVWLLATLFGLPLAAEWGVIAFTLNYIPFIGPFVATVFPTLYALTQFESWQGALAVFACLNVIQFAIGSYIEPRVAGGALAISPFMVLFSILLWTYLWGLFGAFIGVPIAIAVLTLCAEHPSTRWFAELLGPPEETPKAERAG
jgi:predicted PurR-regulated permease PerM